MKDPTNQDTHQAPKIDQESLTDPSALSALADGLESIAGNENAALAAAYIRQQAVRAHAALASTFVADGNLRGALVEMVECARLHRDAWDGIWSGMSDRIQEGRRMERRHFKRLPKALEAAEAALAVPSQGGPEAVAAVEDATPKAGLWDAISEALYHWENWGKARLADDEANRDESPATRVAWTALVICMESLKESNKPRLSCGDGL